MIRTSRSLIQNWHHSSDYYFQTMREERRARSRSGLSSTPGVSHLLYVASLRYIDRWGRGGFQLQSVSLDWLRLRDSGRLYEKSMTKRSQTIGWNLKIKMPTSFSVWISISRITPFPKERWTSLHWSAEVIRNPSSWRSNPYYGFVVQHSLFIQIGGKMRRRVKSILREII